MLSEAVTTLARQLYEAEVALSGEAMLTEESKNLLTTRANAQANALLEFVMSALVTVQIPAGQPVTGTGGGILGPIQASTSQIIEAQGTLA